MQPLSVIYFHEKNSFTDIWLGFKYASVLCEFFQKYLKVHREITLEPPRNN